MQLQHKFGLSVQSKAKQLEICSSARESLEKRHQMLCRLPASKSQIHFTHTHFGQFSCFTYYGICTFQNCIFICIYIYIYAKSQELFACCGASTPENKRKKVHLRIHESAWLCGDTLPASTRNNNKPHTYSQPGCFDLFHHILCPSTQSEVEIWIYLSWKTSKQPISEVSLTINAIIQYRSGLGCC